MYEDITDNAKISKMIDKNLENKEAALTVLEFIESTSVITVPKAVDPVGQWLELFAINNIGANKLNGSLIEIRPSGTHGFGKSDRMLLEVTDTTVQILKASEADH